MERQEKLKALRKLMTDQGLAGYIIPASDPHQDEYIPACWQFRSWLSGFTGSAGTIVVTAGMAGLWTDSRYFLQAERQLEGSGIGLFKLKDPSYPGTCSLAGLKPACKFNSRPGRSVFFHWNGPIYPGCFEWRRTSSGDQR